MTDVGGPRRRGPGTDPIAWSEGGLAHHAPALRAVAAGMCRNAAERDDLVQDTFERALRHQAGGNGPVRNLRAWLVTILRNAFIDRVRAEHATAELDDLPALDPEPQPPWAEVTLADVRAAMTAIDADLRAVFDLHYMEGLRYREIAIRLAVPENTVASRLFRARKALRDQLLGPSSQEAQGEERIRTER